MDVDMRMMAGQQLSQRPVTAIEKAAGAASVAYFGGLLEELLAGRNGSAFRKGFVDASLDRSQWYDTANHGAYEAGFDAYKAGAA